VIILDKFGDRRQRGNRDARSLEQGAFGIVRRPGRRSPQAICDLNFQLFTAFLPGSAQNVENDVTHSKQTTELFLPGATTSQYSPRTSIATPLSNRELRLLKSELTHRKQTIASRSNRELSTNGRRNNSRSPLTTRHWSFLTGSAPQTELAVTNSKQTTGTLLTGSRTAFRHLQQCAAIKENF
jgi:hypothetical protein